MTRLFQGTKWDRPPQCERCGLLETECRCGPPPPAPEAPVDPGTQQARIGVEKRPRGKVATVIRGLTDRGEHLSTLASALKAACGSGGTVKDGVIELQGDQAERVTEELTRRGYRLRKR